MLNLWRRHSFEPVSRGIIRGTVYMIGILILLGFTIYTVAHGLNPAALYGRRSFRQLTHMPQPHFFTNHCTSAMMPHAVGFQLASNTISTRALIRP